MNMEISEKPTVPVATWDEPELDLKPPKVKKPRTNYTCRFLVFIMYVAMCVPSYCSIKESFMVSRNSTRWTKADRTGCCAVTIAWPVAVPLCWVRVMQCDMLSSDKADW